MCTHERRLSLTSRKDILCELDLVCHNDRVAASDGCNIESQVGIVQGTEYHGCRTLQE